MLYCISLIISWKLYFAYLFTLIVGRHFIYCRKTRIVSLAEQNTCSTILASARYAEFRYASRFPSRLNFARATLPLNPSLLNQSEGNLSEGKISVYCETTK